MTWILIKAVLKARRQGLLHLVPATGATRLDCLMDKCAKCCTTLGTPVVTPAEAENIAAESLIKDKSGRIFTKSENSVCSLLRDGFCSIYPTRPRGCREYPWYNIDGRLYYDNGCPGIKHDRDQRPSAADIMPFEKFFPLTSRPVIWLVKNICVREHKTQNTGSMAEKGSSPNSVRHSICSLTILNSVAVFMRECIRLWECRQIISAQHQPRRRLMQKPALPD